MNRIKLARQIVSYLEERINCENVMDFAEKNLEKRENHITKKLVVTNVPVGYDIINYNDAEDSDSNIKNKKWINKLFGTFDFITEANYTGFEFFPYLYGVLNCHNNDNSKVYIFYEYFANNLVHLIDNIQHPSEWYDIAFQIIMINYCVETVNGFEYDGNIQNHLYKKLEKPYYKEYELDGTRIKINHKYLIVLWITEPFKKITEQSKIFSTNIDLLLKYLTDNKERITVYPSNKIINLLQDAKNNSTNIPSIILQYYGSPKDSVNT
jgi:hypothetical protein